MTRCRIPPENSCGYAAARAAGIPTCSSSSPTRARAARAVVPGSCSRMGSMIWWPTVWHGFSAFMAPWKTTEIPFQRTVRISVSVKDKRSRPSNVTPPVTEAVSGNRRGTARASVVLPHADSPASPRTSPGSMVRLTSSTAATSPRSLA